MELWVRDQTKTGLYKIDNVYIHEDEDKTIHIWTDGINKYLKYYLGSYKSKERALEVLDEIQNILKPKYILDSSSIKPDGDSWVENGMILQNYNANAKIEELSTYVYEMPEE